MPTESAHDCAPLHSKSPMDGFLSSILGIQQYYSHGGPGHATKRATGLFHLLPGPSLKVILQCETLIHTYRHTTAMISKAAMLLRMLAYLHSTLPCHLNVNYADAN